MRLDSNPERFEYYNSMLTTIPRFVPTVGTFWNNNKNTRHHKNHSSDNEIRTTSRNVLYKKYISDAGQL
jgi:hypothetical protein